MADKAKTVPLKKKIYFKTGSHEVADSAGRSRVPSAQSPTDHTCVPAGQHPTQETGYSAASL